MTRIVLGGLQFTNKGESIFRSMTSVINMLFRYIFLHKTQEIYVNEDTDVVLFAPDSIRLKGCVMMQYTSTQMCCYLFLININVF